MGIYAFYFFFLLPVQILCTLSFFKPRLKHFFLSKRLFLKQEVAYLCFLFLKQEVIYLCFLFLKQEVVYLCFLFLLSASCTNTLYTFCFRPQLKHFFLSKRPFLKQEVAYLCFLFLKPEVVYLCFLFLKQEVIYLCF